MMLTAPPIFSTKAFNEPIECWLFCRVEESKSMFFTVVTTTLRPCSALRAA
ncbi:Uncharacterised protein [Vibrio cholerae]|nr:Uncharacterised protein [Vibrio cholerae]